MAERKKKILLVEDDIFVKDIYTKKFGLEGYEIILAENGVEALKKMEEDIPDIILMDIMMPYMDGLEALAKIRENETWKKIPVIMLSNLSDKERIDFAMEKGASECLIKAHFTPAEVAEKVRKLIEN